MRKDRSVFEIKYVTFVTLGKDKFKVKVKVEDEKHIYVIRHTFLP